MRARLLAATLLLLTGAAQTAGEPELVRSLETTAPDPCPKGTPGWTQGADGPQTPVGGLNGSREGRLVHVQGRNVIGTYDICKNTWEMKYVQPERTDPARGIVLGDRILIPRHVASRSSYDFFDNAVLERPNGSELRLPAKGAPGMRAHYVLADTGTHAIIWGGNAYVDGQYTSRNDGALLNLRTGRWAPMTTRNAPSPRAYASAVWTGKKLIVWGGTDGANLRTDGGVYDPATNTWSPITNKGAPPGRYRPIALWTGSRLLITAGQTQHGNTGLGDAFLYDPKTDTWSEVPNAPALLGQRNWIRAFVIPNEHVLIVDTFRLQFADLDLKAGRFVDAKTPETLLGRSSPGLAFTGRRLILVGGYKQDPSWVNPCNQVHDRPCDPPSPTFLTYRDTWIYEP